MLRYSMSVVLLLGVVSGCGGSKGPQRVSASGSVSVGGKPLAEGVIRFIPTGTSVGPAATAMIKEGAYRLIEADGPVIGTQRVEIEAVNHLGFAMDDEKAYAEKAKQGWRPPANPVPVTYNRDSTLSIDVKLEGNHTYDFALKAR